MDKICTYCMQTGHRASQCPHRPAECCTEIGADAQYEPLIPSWIVGIACVACLIGYTMTFFVL